MLNGGMKMINKIYLAECGYCVNDIKHIFKNTSSKKLEFPANCFVFHHDKYGYILYDTGYAPRIYKGGLINKIYTSLNPTFIKEDETLVSKLSRTGIKAESINYIVISHMHPDHISGLKDFKNAKFVVSSEIHTTYKRNRKKDLLLKNLIPEDFLERIIILEEKAIHKRINNISYYDIFGEDFLLFDISGHAKGQIGLYLPKGKLIVVADAYWFKSELYEDKNYSFITKQIMSNYKSYKETHEVIRNIMSLDEEIFVVSSHEKINEVEEMGYVIKAYDTKKLY